ncbi:MAG: hypothetical protein Pg6A_19520 [Termitinemataceae bacterium]|nr:MAG: hypothetical protein Pg6A_19520 [Termitinemataceae bacterium]
MTVYKNEKALVNDFCKAVKESFTDEFARHKCHAQKIETGATGVGVPDLRLFTPKGATDVEFKLCDKWHKDKQGLYYCKPKFRPGQWDWAARVFNTTNKRSLVFAVIGFKDMTTDDVFVYNYVVMPMTPANWYASKEQNERIKSSNDLHTRTFCDTIHKVIDVIVDNV